ncbi:hypothetical protein [Lysobacter gummosus]
MRSACGDACGRSVAFDRRPAACCPAGPVSHLSGYQSPRSAV